MATNYADIQSYYFRPTVNRLIVYIYREIALHNHRTVCGISNSNNPLITHWTLIICGSSRIKSNGKTDLFFFFWLIFSHRCRISHTMCSNVYFTLHTEINRLLPVICRCFSRCDVMCLCMYGTWERLKMDWLPCEWPCVVLCYGRMRQVDSDKKRIKKEKRIKRESCDYVNQQGKRLIMGCVSLDVIPTTSRWRMDAPLMYTIMLLITIYPDRYTHTAHTCIIYTA
jgi:hypothetical protein